MASFAWLTQRTNDGFSIIVHTFLGRPRRAVLFYDAPENYADSAVFQALRQKIGNERALTLTSAIMMTRE